MTPLEDIVDFAERMKFRSAGGARAEYESLLCIVEAASKLDAEMSEKNSGFDSDGAYDRYVQLQSEEALSVALTRLDVVRSAA